MRERLTYVTLGVATAFTVSWALGFPPAVAVIAAAIGISASLLGFWIGDNVVKHGRR
jgi:hypothetical protein